MTKPRKVVEMRAIFLVEDEEALLAAFDPVPEDMPRSLAHAAMSLTEMTAPPGTSELRVFFQAGDTGDYDEGEHWLRTPGVCVVSEPEEKASSVKVVKVTSALVVEDEQLLYRTANWILNRLPNQEHGWKLLDEDGRIDVVECVMALYNEHLPPGVSGPTDSFEMKEFPKD